MLSKKRDYYEALNGIRAYACFGIVIEHVLMNGNYVLSGIIFNKIIPEFGDLVFLFMLISGFSTCCGYFQRIKDGGASLEVFYKKRYKKIWPFFAMLVIIDVIMSPSISSLYEGLADLTLCFGLLPKAGDGITVIGVGWFLGVVFVYYLIFPFTCFLLGTKRRAWFSLIVSLFFSYVGEIYFLAERTNIVYCLPFFLVGGIIFLYRTPLVEFSKKYRWIICLSIVALIMVYHLWITNITRLTLFTAIIIFAIGIEKKGVFINSLVSKISAISLEVYLCHMFMFRVLEKIGFVHPVKGNELLSFLTCSAIVFTGAAIVASVYIKAVQQIKNRIKVKS